MAYNLDSAKRRMRYTAQKKSCSESHMTPYGANSGGIFIGYECTDFDVIVTNIYFSD